MIGTINPASRYAATGSDSQARPGRHRRRKGNPRRRRTLCASLMAWLACLDLFPGGLVCGPLWDKLLEVHRCREPVRIADPKGVGRGRERVRLGVARALDGEIALLHRGVRACVHERVEEIDAGIMADERIDVLMVVVVVLRVLQHDESAVPR